MNFTCDSCNTDLHGKRIRIHDVYLLDSGDFVQVTLCPLCETKLDRDSIAVLAHWLFVRNLLNIEMDG